MTRTHFRAIAKIIDDSTLCNNTKLINKDNLVIELCDYFELLNDRFDRSKFNKACDVIND